jgi:hypothetical protein
VATVTFPAVTLNEPVKEPGGKVTEAGAVTAEVGFDDKSIVAPPVGAAAVNVMVHEVLLDAGKETGKQLNPWSPGLIVTVPPAFEVPRSVANASAAELIVSCNWEEASEV